MKREILHLTMRIDVDARDGASAGGVANNL